MLQVILFFYTEINRVRNELFHGVVKNAEVDGMFTELQLPTPSGPRVKLSEKVYAPVKEYPKVRLPAYMHGNCVITKLAFKWVCLCNVVIESGANKRVPQTLQYIKKDILKNRFISNYFMLVAFISPVKSSKTVVRE